MNGVMKHWMDNSSSMNPRWIYPPFVTMVGWYELWVWCPYQTYTETNRTLHVSDPSFNHLSLSLSLLIAFRCSVKCVMATEGPMGKIQTRREETFNHGYSHEIRRNWVENKMQRRTDATSCKAYVFYAVLWIVSHQTTHSRPCRAKEDFNHTLKTTGWMGWKEKLGGQVALRSNPIGCRSKAWILTGTQPRRRRGGCPNSAGFVRPCVCFGRSIQNVKASPKDRVCGPRFPLRACFIHWGWTCPKSTRPFDNPRKVLLLWSERIESHLKVEHWKGHTLLGCLGLTNIVLDTVTKRRMLSTANHAYLISTIPLFLIGSR